MATHPSDSAVVIGEGGVEPARQHQEGLHASGFQGTITERATDAVVLGPRLYDDAATRFTTPDTFVAGPRGLARLRRAAEVAAHLEVARCRALGPGYPPF